MLFLFLMEALSWKLAYPHYIYPQFFQHTLTGYNYKNRYENDIEAAQNFTLTFPPHFCIVLTY